MNHERVSSLLASGLKPTQVATIIGCTPARISQLLQEEDFKLLLSSKIAVYDAEATEETSLSAKYHAAEHALIAQVMDLAPASELKDITAALRVIGERQEKMKTRTLLAGMPQQLQQVIVAISLPAHALAAPTVQRTAQNEIISIGDNTIAPLSSTAVTNLFTKLKGKLPAIAVTTTKENDHEQSSSNRGPEEGLAVPQEESFLSYAGSY